MNSKHLFNGKFATRNASKKSRLPIFIFSFIFTMGVSGAVLSNFEVKSIKEVKKVVSSAKKVVSVPVAKAERSPDRLDKAIEAMKKEVVDHLREGESKGHVIKEGELFATFDPTKAMMSECRKVGGKHPEECMSYGNFQMKLPTIKMWAKQLEMGELTDMQALELALDTNKASEFVTRVIFELKGSCFAWTVCRNEKTWFDTKVGTIRELESVK